MAALLKICILACALLLHTSVCQSLEELQIKPPITYKTLAEGKRLLLTCSYQTANVQSVTWIGPDGTILLTDDKIGRTVVSEAAAGNTTNVYLTYLSVVESQSGIYSCIGLLTPTVNETKEVRVTIEVNVFIPIKIVDTEAAQRLNFGEDGVVNCAVVGKPLPEVIWKKDDVMLTLDNGKFAFERSTFNLLVRDINLDDEGVYECIARETSEGQMDFITIDVSVMVKPTITRLITSIVPVVGADFELICEADGKPPPTYKFFKYNDTMFSLDNLDGDLNEAGNIITIRNASKYETEGSYTCEVENYAGTTDQSIDVVVYEAPTIISSSNATAVVGDLAELSCAGAGDPIPEIEFTRFGTVINGTTEQYAVDNIDTSAKLTFFETTSGDSGSYVCRVFSKAGFVEKELYLDIQYSPKDAKIRSVYACPNSEATLGCQFSANPPANTTWGVYIENQLVPVNKSYVEYVKDFAFLQISTDSAEAYRTYTCQADNGIGMNSADATVFEATEPNPPTNIEILLANTQDFTFSFASPVEDNVDILNYVLEVDPVPTSGFSKQSIGANARSHTVSNLEHNTTYTITLQTQNCVGVGVKGDAVTVATTPIGKPEPVSVISGRAAVAHDEYTVQWKLNSAAGGSIEKIVLKVKKITSEIDGDVASEEVEDIILLKGDQEFEDQQYTLSDLDPSSKYEVTLTAHNEVESSEKSTFEFITNIPPPPETTSSVGNGIDQELSAGGSGLLIGIIILVLVLLLIIIDCICFCTRDWGVTMWFYLHTCGKGKSKSKDIESGNAGDTKASNLTPISEIPANETAPLKGNDNAAVADEKEKEETNEKLEENKTSSPLKEEEKSLIENSKPEEDNNAAA